jgi:anti-anti-sigma factor
VARVTANGKGRLCRLDGDQKRCRVDGDDDTGVGSRARSSCRFGPSELRSQQGVLPGVTLTIRRERTTEGFVVRLIGDLDSRMASAVAQAITSTSEFSVVVDLSDLSSLDDHGLRAIVEAGSHLASDGKALSVVGARGGVMTAIRSSDLVSFT